MFAGSRPRRRTEADRQRGLVGILIDWCPPAPDSLITAEEIAGLHRAFALATAKGFRGFTPAQLAWIERLGGRLDTRRNRLAENNRQNYDAIMRRRRVRLFPSAPG